MRQHFLKSFLPVRLLITSLMTIPISVQAAVVVLKNGDRITGRIVKMEKQRLEIDPPFSDIIKIKWEAAQSIWQFLNRGNIPHFSWSCADEAGWSAFCARATRSLAF
jgi:hypothetical protein